MADSPEEDDDAVASLENLFDDENQLPPPFPLRPLGAPSTMVIPLFQDARDALGGRVWKASLFLKRCLEQEKITPSLGGLAVLDVGAGIGALGLACALARPVPPAFVALTDKQCLMPLLYRNVEVARLVADGASPDDAVAIAAAAAAGKISGAAVLAPPVEITAMGKAVVGGGGGIDTYIKIKNEERQVPRDEKGQEKGEKGGGQRGACRVVASPLDWLEHGNGPQSKALLHLLHAETGKRHFDLILVADCVYYPQLYRPLVEALAGMAGGETKVAIVNDDGRTDAAGVEKTTGRRWDEEFFDLLKEKFMWGKEEGGKEGKGEDRLYPEAKKEEGGGGPFRVVVAKRRRVEEEKEEERRGMRGKGERRE